MKLEWLVVCVGLLAFGCGSDGAPDDGKGNAIPDTPLSGKIDGESWTFSSGRSDAFFSDEQQLWVELYAVNAGSCDSTSSPNGHHLIVTVPREPGTYRLGLLEQRSATFVLETSGGTTDNLVTTDGTLIVDDVSATKVSARASLEFDADNNVTGRFEATICP